MTNTLISDFFLAVLDPAKGKPVIDGQKFKVAMAGTAILELVRREVLTLVPEGSPLGKPGRLVRTGGGADTGGGSSQPLEPPLQDVVDRSDGRKPKDAIARIGGSQTWKDRVTPLRDLAAAPLIAEGVLHRVDSEVMRVFPTVRFEVSNPLIRDQLIRRLAAILREEVPVNDHDASVLSVLHAADALPKVFPGEDKKLLKARGKAISEGDWASEGVRKAIQEMNATVIAAIAAGGAVAAGSS